MRSLGIIAAVLMSVGFLCSSSNEVNAQVYYVGRPAFSGYYRPAYPVAYPSYDYYGGWYSGSYMNNYGNYGAYHVMTPVWNGGYRYRYW
jgi:hypothetical protein